MCYRLKIKTTCELKLNDSPGLDVLSLHVIHSNCTFTYIYLVGQALNVLSVPTVHPTLSTVCLDMSYFHPLLAIIRRHSEKFIAHGLTHDLKFRHLHVVARRVNLIFHLITFHFVSVCYRFISVYDFVQF